MNHSHQEKKNNNGSQSHWIINKCAGKQGKRLKWRRTQYHDAYATMLQVLVLLTKSIGKIQEKFNTNDETATKIMSEKIPEIEKKKNWQQRNKH